MEPLTDRQKALVEASLPAVRGVIARAVRRGNHVSDEAVSDAHWQVIRAAKRHTGDDNSFRGYILSWVKGALFRALLKADRYSNRGVEAFEVFADDACRRTDTVDEVEASSPDLQWADFSDDATGDVARDLRLLRIGLSRITGSLKPVAEAMAEGLGIRCISDRLGLTFHEARTKYDEVHFQLRSALGAPQDPNKHRPKQFEEIDKKRQQIGPILDQLPEELKSVATALLEGMTHPKIAGKLGLSRGIVERRVSEIRRIARGGPNQTTRTEKDQVKRLEKKICKLETAETDLQQIGAVLGQLPEKLKLVATALLEGMSLATIAAKFGLSYTAISKRAIRIRRIAEDAAGRLQPTPAAGSDTIEMAPSWVPAPTAVDSGTDAGFHVDPHSSDPISLHFNANRAHASAGGAGQVEVELGEEALPTKDEETEGATAPQPSAPAVEGTEADRGGPIEALASTPTPIYLDSGLPHARGAGTDLIEAELACRPPLQSEEEPGSAYAPQVEAMTASPTGNDEPAAIDPTPTQTPASNPETAQVAQPPREVSTALAGLSGEEATVPLTDRERALVESAMPFVWARVEAVGRRGRYLSDDAISDSFWGLICAARQHVKNGHTDDTFPACAAVWATGGIFRSSKKARRFTGGDLDLTAARDYRDSRTLSVSDADIEGKDLAWTEWQDPRLSAFARNLRLLRIALSRIEGERLPVANAMAEGLGIRTIAERLDVTFCYARTRYYQVLREIKETVGLETYRPGRKYRKHIPLRKMGKGSVPMKEERDDCSCLGPVPSYGRPIEAEPQPAPISTTAAEVAEPLRATGIEKCTEGDIDRERFQTRTTIQVVAEMLACGLGRKETAETLGISRDHVKKLRARIRREAAAKAGQLAATT